MATLEEIMLGLKSQEGDDKKEGFSNALLGQVTPTTPSEAGNKLLSPFGLSLGEQQPQPFGPVNQQAQPISILGQAPATPSGAVNQLRDEYRLAFADQQAQLNAQAQAQPLGPQSPFLPSGEKAVYAMTPEEVAARQVERGQIESVPGLFGQVGQTLSNMFVQPMVNLAEFSAKQKYGTGISAEGAPTGQPIKPNTLLGDFATLPATALNVAGIGTDIVGLTGSAAKNVAEYVTGLEFDGQPTMEAVKAQPTTTPALESVVTTTPDLGSGVAGNTVMAAPEPSSEQIESAQPRLTTVGGASLSEFLSGAAMPEQGFARAERQMAGRGTTLTPEQFNELSAQREARLAARPDFMRGVSDRERRGTGEMSMADATKLTGGDRDKARAMIELQRQGRDPMTGQVVKDRGELTFDQKLAQNKFDFDVAKFSFEQEKEASDAATALRKSEEAAKYAVRDTLRQNENVMRKAQRASQNIGLTTTGATGALFGMIPGTGAYDQKATIETLQADAAFSTLQRMRDASKTGGALGNVSERELDLLMGSVGNLKIGQSEEQFRNNLAEYVNLRNEALLNIYDAFAADYSPEAANEAFKISSREDLIPSETGSSQSRGTPVETQSGRYEVTTI